MEESIGIRGGKSHTVLDVATVNPIAAAI